MCDALMEIFEELYRDKLNMEVKQLAKEQAQIIAEEKAKIIIEERNQIFGKLISALLKLGRIEDVEKASLDIAYREQLFQEFGLG